MTTDGPSDDRPVGDGPDDDGPDDEKRAAEPGRAGEHEIAIGPTIAEAVLALALAALIVLIFCDAFGVV